MGLVTAGTLSFIEIHQDRQRRIKALREPFPKVGGPSGKGRVGQAGDHHFVGWRAHWPGLRVWGPGCSQRPDRLSLGHVRAATTPPWASLLSPSCKTGTAQRHRGSLPGPNPCGWSQAGFRGALGRLASELLAWP